MMVARMLIVASRSIDSPSHTQLCSGMVMLVPMVVLVKVSLMLAASLSDMILECLREERVGACLRTEISCNYGHRDHALIATQASNVALNCINKALLMNISFLEPRFEGTSACGTVVWCMLT